MKQACDCCHARKIRCDGGTPCANCQATELQCTYLAVPKKKGPKGKRVSKIARLPEHVSRPFVSSSTQSVRPITEVPPVPLQRAESHVQSHASSTSAPSNLRPVHRSLPIASPAYKDPPPKVVEATDNAFSRSPLVSDDLIKACLDAFFTHKYPIMPIIDHAKTYALVPKLDDLPEQYSLLTALCAMIVLQPEFLTTLSKEQLPSSKVLIDESIRARKFCDHTENPSLAHVQTSFFFFAALFGLGKDSSAWFYIRESMTMLQLQRLHEEATYTTMADPLHKTYCRRTFWILFITERAYALQRHRPLTLQRTIDLPTVDPGPESTILSGFLDLVSLFQNFDDSFMSLWNLSGSNTDSITSPQLLIQLQEILNFAIPNVAERTEIQQADLLISKQWLKTMVWQLSLTKRLLSSSSSNESMSFHYPVCIARDVVAVSRMLTPKAFEANGIGILEKVFDIGCSLSDVLQLNPSFVNASGSGIGPRDYLVQLIRILGTAPGGNKYLRLLASKADESLQVRLQGSLSDSGTSPGSDRLHEVMEEDDDVEFEDHDGQDIDQVASEGMGSAMDYSHASWNGQSAVRGPEVQDLSYVEFPNQTLVSVMPADAAYILPS